jgi:simple sugar transport system permease protein
MGELWLQFVLIIDATLRVATPLILCAMAGIFSERSGIIDISLEGKMLISAFVAASLAAVTGSPLVALGGAIAASVLFSLIHGFACITHKGDQVVSGLAINILASGMTVMLGIAIFAQGGQTPYLGGGQRFSPIHLPFTEAVRDIPVLGPVYAEFISGHNMLVWIALIAVAVTGYVVAKTRFGLRLRAVGEKPEAVDTAGVSVVLLRYQAVVIAGLLCGIAGAYLSVAHGAGFSREMTAGKGYIALAAMIFGNWRPLQALYACLMFGFFEAVASRLQGVELPLFGQISTDLVLALPYVLTVVFLAGFIGRATPPAAIGIPYVKER